jgi:5-methylcytosine-specific restriction protein B
MKYYALSKLLMISGKNILFAGPPGAGKTRLAFSIAGRYKVVSGYEGLTFKDLIAKYSLSKNGKVIITPGPLTQALLDYYLGSEREPIHIVFDEINRVNVETLLGPIFTALDIVHRMNVSIIDYSILKSIRETVSQDIAENIDKLVEKCRLKGLDGLPLPYSMRLLATMNTYDVTTLYRLGYALQRRFVVIQVSDSRRDPEPKLSIEKLNKVVKESGKKYDEIVAELSDLAEIGLEELLIHKSNPSIVEGDLPTIIDIENELRNISVKELVRGYEELWKILAIVYKYADEFGIVLGPAFKLDAIKFVLVHRALNNLDLLRNITIDDIIDLFITYVLPQFHIAVSKAVIEAIIGYEKLKHRIENMLTFLEELLGESSITYMTTSSMRRLLPG